MISDQLKDTAREAMEYALKNGCSSARVSVIVSQSNSFEYRNTQLDKLQRSTENKMYVELFVDGRYGSVSTNRVDKNEIHKLIDDGILSTRYLSEDPFRQLPDPSRYFRGNGKDLDLKDNSYESIPTETKINLLQQTVEEVYDKDKRIISVGASYGDACGGEYMIASNGFEGESSDTAFSLSAEVSLKTEGDARPESYWYDSSVYWNDLQKSGIATKGLERALRKIGQQKVRSGQYNMLLDNTASSRLVSPLVSAMYGTALQQKSSFLLGKLGEKITSEKFTLKDQPHLPHSFGSRWFDGEGVATHNRAVISGGMLQTYFIDTYNSSKMKVMPTVSSPSILVAESGMNDFDGLLKAMHNGIWVTGFNGGNTNPTTGDFSFGVEGFLVENGKISQPVGEMNVTGNMLTLWTSLAEVGNDPRLNSSWRIPSLLFADVSFSGL